MMMRKAEHDIESLLRSGRFELDADFEQTLWARLKRLQPQVASPGHESRHRDSSDQGYHDRHSLAVENSETNSRLIPALAVGLTAVLAAALFWIVLAPSPQPIPIGPPANTPALTPTAAPPTADPAARPGLSFIEDELTAEVCEPTFTLPGELGNSSRSPNDHAAGVEIGYSVIRGNQYIQGVELEPATWIRIEPGERVAYQVTVTLDPKLWDAAPDETEVKLRLLIIAEINRSPDAYRTRATVTLVKRCQGTER